jgi:hypothetical protein
MDRRSTIGVVVLYGLAVASLGAQGHGSPPPHAGGPHGTPGATPAPQGPKSPNPGSGHGQGPGHGQGTGRSEGARRGNGGATGSTSVADHLAAKPQLSQRLQGMLPSGMTVDQAADGFKNLGQFVAAVNVSHNLDIPFDQLKGQLTGPSATSLGEAIHTLKPAVDAKGEAARAQGQARDMMRGPAQ